MFSQKVRSLTEKYVEAVAQFVAKTGLTPNMLTLLGCMFMMSTGLMIAYGYLITAGVCTVLFSMFDALDGSVARVTNSITRFGAFFDSCLDRYAEIALFIGIFHYLISQGYQPLPMFYLIALALTGSLLVSYNRARAEGLGFECKGGLFSRFERLIVLVTTFVLAGVYGDHIMVYGMAIMALFTHITAIQRILHIYTEDKKSTERSAGRATDGL